MDDEKRALIGRMIRYLSNVLLGISLFVFVMNLVSEGVMTYSNNLLWTQLNSMWIVVVMLMMVETYYLPKMGIETKSKEVKVIKHISSISEKK